MRSRARQGSRPKDPLPIRSRGEEKPAVSDARPHSKSRGESRMGEGALRVFREDHAINQGASPTYVEGIIQGDCLKVMERIGSGSVDLVFADPPFNIGYDYDAYNDQRPPSDYLAWCDEWLAQIARVLKPTGTFWLAIGDEYAAELKVAAQRTHGFHCRSWVIWYYTFGVHCVRKFARSHAHLFHFVRDPKAFTFNDLSIRVPSARATTYADARANPLGRLPDDTWILRPQDMPEAFEEDEDTWFFPRVAGTFKERRGFHGCQMPEQLLGRIIKVSSNPGDLVLDPFAGSGTTLVAAKKLQRRHLGVELSADYVARIEEHLNRVNEGDPLVGSADPRTSAPSTADGKPLKPTRNKRYRRHNANGV